MDFIGNKLEDVVNYLTEHNIKYKIVDNNFCIDGDTKLVTNFVMDKNGTAIVTIGDFIFDVRNKQNGR